MTARLRSTFLMYAALQFVVLTAIAMRVFPGGYSFFHNFFSELGGTRTWAGEANHTGATLFAIALGTLGIAFIAFAGAWRAFAFAHGRARWAGIAAQIFGSLSGAAFVAIAATPVDVALDLHNTFVVAAFGLLLGYAACLTLVWAKNGATRAELTANVSYVVLVCAYVVIVVIGVRQGISTETGRRTLVVSQKVMAYVSMLYIAYVTARARAK